MNTEYATDDAMFPPERWAAIFRSHVQLIFRELSHHLGYSLPPLIERMVKDARRFIKNDQFSKRDSLPLHNRRNCIS